MLVRFTRGFNLTSLAPLQPINYTTRKIISIQFNIDLCLGLSAKTTSAETFLLSTAALANLTFMESGVVPLLRTYNTAKILVAAVKKQQGPKSPKKGLQVSIYIQDQVAAVLANMAANPDCRAEVVKYGGLPLLLQFLMAKAPTSNSDLKAEDYAQMAATERVLQKSAIAISRYVAFKNLMHFAN
jgi:hypothetical protein